MVSNTYTRNEPRVGEKYKHVYRRNNKLYDKSTGRRRLVIYKDEVNDKLAELYDDPRYGYKGVHGFHSRLSRDFAGVTRKKVQDFLRNNETNQVHRRPVKYDVKQAPVVKKPLEKVSADLVILRDNTGRDTTDTGRRLAGADTAGAVRDVLLTVVDNFTRFAWVKLLRNKTAGAVVMAFRRIFRDKKPRVLLTDNGPEFKNALMTNWCRVSGIKQIYSKPYAPQMNGLVERFNGTIKRAAEKWKTQYNAQDLNRKVIKQLVYSYNHTKHSALGGFTPYNVFNDPAVAEKSLRYQENRPITPGVLRPLNRGDVVRVALRWFKDIRKKRKLKKYDYKRQYTYELFVIARKTKMIRGRQRQTQYYYLKPYGDTPTGLIDSDDKFLRNDLLKVDVDNLIVDIKPDEFVVKKILDKKTTNGVVYYKVKFEGYNKPEWVEAQPAFQTLIDEYEARSVSS